MRFERSELWDLTLRSSYIQLRKSGEGRVLVPHRISLFLNDGEKYKVTHDQQQRFLLTPEHSSEVSCLGSGLLSRLRSHKLSRQRIKSATKSHKGIGQAEREGLLQSYTVIYNWTIFSLMVEIK